MLRKLPPALALTAMLFFLSACPEQAFDEPDYCSVASVAQVSGLQLGDPYEGFAPLGPESYSEIQYGSQGGAMLFFKVRAMGEALPACMTVNVLLESNDGRELGRTQVSVRFFEDARDGARTSQALRINLPYGESYEGMPATLTATIGAAESSAAIVMHEPS